MSSDSDSDLEFLAEIQTTGRSQNPQSVQVGSAKQGGNWTQNQSNNTQANASGTELASLRQEFWEKLGENEILRSQLNKSQADHQRNLGELLARQVRDKEEHQKEVEEMRRILEKERIQHQFLLAELRLKNSGSSSSSLQPPAANSTNSASATPNTSSASTSPGPMSLPSRSSVSNKTRTAAHAAFSDGFVLKKPKITPSTGSLTGTSSGIGPDSSPGLSSDPNTGGLSNSSSSAALNQSDSSRLMTFLIHHRAPGFEQASLQLLFGYKTENKLISSIGQDISMSLSLGEFATKIVGYIEHFSSTLENDAPELLFSILYDSFFLDLPFSSQQSNVSNGICEILLAWVKRLEPLPTFQELKETGSLRVGHARLFTCILYGLDILLAADWDFELPYELCRRILSFSYAPHLCSRAIYLMAAHPHSQFASLMTFQFPSVPVEPSVESLFSGLADCPKLTAVELSRKAKYGSKFCRFVTKTTDLDALQNSASRLSLAAFEYMQTASIRLADALMRTSSTSPSVDQHVLSLLSGAVDLYTLNNGNPVVDQCVFYLWCRDHTSLRQNLDAGGMTELCVCLTKLVYDYKDSSATVEQARQLLQVLTSIEEIDRLYEVFELDTEYNEYENHDLMIDT